MGGKPVRGFIATVIMASVSVGGCGGAGEEELTERPPEAGAADDGAVEIGDDGAPVRVETDEGTVATGSGMDLPADLTFPLADGGEVTTAGTDGSYVFAAVQYPTDRYDEIVDLYKDWTSENDRDWELIESTTEMSGETVRSAQWVSGSSAINVNDCISSSDEFDAVCVTLNQSG